MPLIVDFQHLRVLFSEFVENELILQNKAWLSAARPRTLFLSIACTGMGNLVANLLGEISMPILLLSLSTTVLLQILSNFANDLGDTIHGADSASRSGPKRAVQSGAISAQAMRKAVIWTAILSFLSGNALLIVAFHGHLFYLLLFLGVGIGAIAAAYFYTNGKKPYGYRALGDVFVFLFFGPVAVLGTLFLHLKTLPVVAWYPAIAMGLFSTGVLNLNNMRDMVSDKQAGKLTIPLLLGFKGAKVYHALLISVGAYLLWYFAHNYVPMAAPVILALGVINLILPILINENKAFDKLLPLLSISTFLMYLIMAASA